MYTITPKSSTPLHIQLYKQMRNDILQNMKKGDKLPSIRSMASLYNISKTTVESAYSQLYAEGYIESRPKSGYFVSDLYFEESIADKEPPLSTHDAAKPKEYRFDFFPAALHPDDFPLKIWKRLSAKVLRDDSIDFGSYPDGQGEMELRVEIAKYLGQLRGVNCTPEQIVITSGFIDSLKLVASLTKESCPIFGIEVPGYHIAHKVFRGYGFDVDYINVDSQGMSIQKLSCSQAKIIYITPSHQYPTGVTMPVANRQKIIEIMHQRDGFIIEDDYDSELKYDSRPIPSLQGLDRYDRVIYLGTFAKALSPALRVGYLLLPRQLLKRYQNSYESHFAKVSLSTQKTLALFMKEGHFQRHLRRIRAINRRKHNLMRDTLKATLKESMHIATEGGGLAILIQPTRPLDWDKLKRLSQEAGLKIYLAKERSGGDFEAVRMGFGGLTQEEIVEGIEEFRRVWEKSMM